MTYGSRIGCEMVEFHRFGGERTQLLSPDNKYIRTTGYDEPASEVCPCVDQERSLDLLYQLRYRSDVKQDQVQDAQIELGRYAIAFLPSPAVKRRTTSAARSGYERGRVMGVSIRSLLLGERVVARQRGRGCRPYASHSRRLLRRIRCPGQISRECCLRTHPRPAICKKA